MCGEWLRSSIGKKTLMALSGLILVGFVIMHLAGNLLIFLGADAINAYAKKLRDLGPMLWVARAGLLLAVIVHLVTSLQLSIENRRARPVRYAVQRWAETTLAARTMMLSGLLLLAYVVYHLLHVTFHVAHPELTRFTDHGGRISVYAMVVLSFQRWPIVLAYMMGMAALGLHLSHGIASSAQTLGVNSERTIRIFAWIGRLLAFLLFAGYTAIPVAVLLGFVGQELIVTSPSASPGFP